jgi:hypothetical protein
MPSLTETEADALVHTIGTAFESGARALEAVCRGEHADPTAIEALAGALQAVYDDERVTYPRVNAEDVDRVRRLRGLLAQGAPSSEARALAAKCLLILNDEHARTA